MPYTSSASSWLLLSMLVLLISYTVLHAFVSNAKVLSFPHVHSGELQTKNLVLSYFSGKFDLQLFNIFVRSLRATGSSAVIVVMIHGFDPSDDAKALAEVFEAQLLPVPEFLLKDIPWANDGMVFRFRAWNWFLRKNQQKFCHVLNADMDVYFQTDPFACFFGMHCNEKRNILHSFAENPALRIGACSVHRNWYMNDCKQIGGEKYFEQHRHKMRICSGFSIGTVRAYLVYMQMMEDHISQTGGQCNDQPIHNILIWGRLMKEIETVHVWDYFSGPVKTIDAGYIQDEFGRIINERGLPYCVVHQFKESRNPQFVHKLTSLFPLQEYPKRVHLEDIRFPVCAQEECKGIRVHSSVGLMIEQNISGGWRGALPPLKRISTPQGPLPEGEDLKGHGYAVVET